MPKLPAWPLAALGCYAAAYFALLFHPGLVRMDDFGFLQSAIETLRRHRPYTDDWLAPYSAAVSTLSALAFAATGNFPLSTWDLEAVFALGNFLLLYRLLRARLSERDAALLALMAATQPLYWYKASEFGATAFTYAFILLALQAYLRRSWNWFFAAAFCAFANRQNGVALLVLPAYELWRGEARPRGETKRIAAGLAAFAVAAVLFHLGMNRTVAQVHSIYGGFDARGIIQSLLVGVAAWLAFLSFFTALLGADLKENLRANLQRPWLPGLFTALFALIPVFGSPVLVDFHAPLIGSLDHGHALQRILQVTLPAFLWILDWKIVRLNAALCLSGAFVLLTSLRGFWFDVYLLEVALPALFYTVVSGGPGEMKKPALAFTAALLAAHLGWAYGFKILCDKERLSNLVYERLERRGRIGVEDMTDATFGYLGWKLYDHYCLRQPFRNFASFLDYVRRDGVVIESELPWRRSFRRGMPPGAEIVEEGRTRIGFFRVRYRAMDLHAGDRGSIGPEGLLSLGREAYRRKPLPLDAREWKEYISRP